MTCKAMALRIERRILWRQGGATRAGGAVRHSAARLPGCPGLEDLVRGYLSPEHRDQRGVGCPSAALLD
jgi:hypothetical protein